MPRKISKGIKKKKNGTELTEDQIHHLLHGWILDTLYHPFYNFHGDLGFPFRDEEHRRKLYFEHKNYLFSLAGKHMDFLFRQLKTGEKPRGYFNYET
jgi:hypothetical protein